MGGFEDTLRNMEQSLQLNEIKSFKKKSMMGRNPYMLDKEKKRKTSYSSEGNSWVERSKTVRIELMNKFNIEWIFLKIIVYKCQTGKWM